MKTILIILSFILTYSSFAYDYESFNDRDYSSDEARLERQYYNGLDQFNNIQHNYYAREFTLDRRPASFYCDPITGKCYFR